jgi:hypothetical protein
MGMSFCSFVHLYLPCFVALNSELRLPRSDVSLTRFWCFSGQALRGFQGGDKGDVYSYRVSKYLSFMLWGDTA